jgi:quinol monooxygenase YgiN
VLIIAGWLRVDPASRADYLEGCAAVVEQARSAPGCLDFALSADLLDPGRINVHERWESDEQLHAFRGNGPASATPRCSGIGSPPPNPPESAGQPKKVLRRWLSSR